MMPEPEFVTERCTTLNAPGSRPAASVTYEPSGVAVARAISRMISGMTGPCPQITADLPERTRLPTTRRTSALPDSHASWLMPSSRLTLMPVAAESGATVVTQRTAGLDTIRLGAHAVSVSTRAAACWTPRSTSGRAASVPLHPLRPTALPWRTSMSANVLVTPWSTSFAKLSRISTSGA